MNDAWASWSEQVNGNRPGQFVSMWRHVHDIFTTNGATNATWVWCPDAQGSLATLKELYPGDNYVDWVCMDGYNTGGKGWRSFSQIFGQTYQNLLRITSKPQLIGEMACVEPGGSKANWITDAFSRQLPINFPNIKGFIWWNVNELATKGWDWRIETSPASQQAFATAMQSPVYATNQYAHLETSPIPPL
jgi:mannan endo-1,4-beta-mannosidase